jgi:methylmalonyl-CoA carboxyltransferase large subunit
MTANVATAPATAPDASPVARDPSVAELLARVQAMQAELAALRAAVAGNVPEDVVIAISAAVAAYLGKRAKVRQIHLTGDTAWAREGRAYVQSVHSASRRR